MMSPREPMMLFFPLLLAAALLVTGCTQDAERWTQTEAPKDNRVDFVTMVHKVEFAPGTANPQAGEDRKLADFLAQVNYGYGDQLTLDAGPKANEASADQLAAKRLDAVSKILHKMRAPATVASRPSVDGALSPNAVVVTLGRYVVTPPACPDWTKPEADDFTNVPASNYGCATTTNFGLMVANPSDLVRGSSEGAADGDYGATGIEHYRNGDVSKSLKPELPKLYSGGGGQ